MKQQNDFRLDSTLITCTILLSGLSLLVLYSAGGQNVDTLIRQLIRIGIAFFVMFVFSQLSPGTLARWSPHVYMVGLSLLALVLIFGLIRKGCTITKPAGMATIRNAMIRFFSDGGSGFRVKTQATIIGTASFMISDG